MGNSSVSHFHDYYHQYRHSHHDPAVTPTTAQDVSTIAERSQPSSARQLLPQSASCTFGEMSLPPMTSVDRRLHIAVMQNDLNAVVSAIAAGARVDCPWSRPARPTVKDGVTPLHEAVSLNHVSVAKYLIDRGANVMAVNPSDQFTPLMKASYHGRAAIIPMLVRAGANVAQCDSEGNTCLHICVRYGSIHGNVACVKALIKCGSNVNATNVDGLTPLHVACQWAGSSERIVALLLVAGCDMTAMDHCQFTPLYLTLKCAMDLRHYLPSSLRVDAFKRRISVLRLLLVDKCCDPLGFATFVRTDAALYNALYNSELKEFCVNNSPESLLHICRLHLKGKLGFVHGGSNDLAVKRVNSLSVPASLKDYLCRNVLA